MTDTEQKKAAREFAAYWKDKGYEKGQSQPYWLSLLRSVFGIKEPEKFIEFEDQVHLDNTSFIDGYIPSTRVLIEQKGLGKMNSCVSIRVRNSLWRVKKSLRPAASMRRISMICMRSLMD